MELVNDLNPPLPDRECADTANTMTTTPTTTSTLPQIDQSRDVSSDQEASMCISDDQPMSILMYDEEVITNGCYGDTPLPGHDLTQLALLKLMLRSLPPLVVNKLLSGCRGNSFGGKTREQLHALLSKLTSIHTQQRQVFLYVSM